MEATVTSSEPKPTPASQRLSRKGLVTNVVISGDADIVHKYRSKLLNETPIALVANPSVQSPLHALTLNRDAPSSTSIPDLCSTPPLTESRQMWLSTSI